MNKLLRQLDSCYLIVLKKKLLGAISYIQYRKKKKKSKKKRGRVVFLKCMIFFFYYPLQSMTFTTTEKQISLDKARFEKVYQAGGSIILELEAHLINKPININDPKAGKEFAKLMNIVFKETLKHYQPRA